MRILGWTIFLSFWTLVAAFFHYTLPQRDIVYIQGTEILLQDFNAWNRVFYSQSSDTGAGTNQSRDLRLINTTRANGDVMVYRNEDTGLFGWPPYFKIDTSDLQAEALGAVSTRDDPAWYLVTHYGWRNQLLSIYPNAVSIRPIAGPDAGKPFPFLNVLILVGVGIVWYALWVRWRRFRAYRLDPAFEEIRDNLEGTGDAIADRRYRFRRWVRSWRD